MQISFQASLREGWIGAGGWLVPVPLFARARAA
jgi:hypothetical protein